MPATTLSYASPLLVGTTNPTTFIATSPFPVTDEDLLAFFRYLPRRCLVLLEDIDTAGLKRNEEHPPSSDDAKNSRKRQGDSDSSEKKGISLSGLLNAIDGVASHEGRLLIMTTNKPEAVDEVLIRPGRIDVQVPFTNATQKQARELFIRMYKPDPNGRRLASCSSTSLDEDWTKVKDRHQRRRIQNRIAKRTYRRKLQKLERRAATADGTASGSENPTEPPETRRVGEPENQEQTLPTPTNPALLDTSEPQMCHSYQCLYNPCSDEESTAYPANSSPPFETSEGRTFPPSPSARYPLPETVVTSLAQRNRVLSATRKFPDPTVSQSDVISVGHLSEQAVVVSPSNHGSYSPSPLGFGGTQAVNGATDLKKIWGREAPERLPDLDSQTAQRHGASSSFQSVPERGIMEGPPNGSAPSAAFYDRQHYPYWPLATSSLLPQDAGHDGTHLPVMGNNPHPDPSAWLSAIPQSTTAASPPCPIDPALATADGRVPRILRPLMPRASIIRDCDLPTNTAGLQDRSGIVLSTPGTPAAPAAETTQMKGEVSQNDADGRFPCPHCNNTYKNKWHMKRHSVIHNSDWPYKCNLCGVRFARSDTLKNHFGKCKFPGLAATPGPDPGDIKWAHQYGK
ncbi:hypothetical protein VTK56DRAFT_4313 [Thermocarpiscus australiensis]